MTSRSLFRENLLLKDITDIGGDKVQVFYENGFSNASNETGTGMCYQSMWCVIFFLHVICIQANFLLVLSYLIC